MSLDLEILPDDLVFAALTPAPGATPFFAMPDEDDEEEEGDEDEYDDEDEEDDEDEDEDEDEEDEDDE